MAPPRMAAPQVPEWLLNRYDLAVAFCVPTADAAMVDLLLDRHPYQRRWLKPQETLDGVWPYLRWLDRSEQRRHCATRLWRKTFTNLDEIADLPIREAIEPLWAAAFRDAQVHRAVYGFPGVAAGIDNERFRFIARGLVGDVAAGVIEPGCRPDSSVFATTLPFGGVPGLLADQRGGVAALIKRRTSLLDGEPGLLLHYLRRHGHSLADLLNPRQFEEMTYLLFREEGWDVTLTPKSGDGGKDVVAVREVDGERTVAYVEAKRYKPGRRVGVRVVRELIGTLAADGVNRGTLVTTSHFTGPAQRWGEQQSVADLEFVDRDRLVARIAQALGDAPCAFSMTNGFLCHGVAAGG